MRAATCSVGLVSPRSTCESIGARHAGALGEVAQREVHRLAERLHARPDGGERLTAVAIQSYVITYSGYVSTAPACGT